MVMLIRRHQEACGNTIEINQLYIIMVILLIFLMITILVLHLNLNKICQDKQKTVAQKI